MNRPLIWTIRFAAALGLTSLTLTGEIAPLYLVLSWAAWTASFLLDRHVEWEERLRAWETGAVLGLIAVFLLDFFVWGYSIFICVAHFLLLFQLFKLLGLKQRKDCLQILLFSFFQMLSACTLSVDAWQAVILLLLIPTATAGLFWQQIGREIEMAGTSLSPATQRPYRRLVTVMCLSAIPVNLVLAGGMFVIFPRLAFRGAFSNFGAGRSGYNEQVNLAQTGVLNLDSSSVMWMQITPEADRSQWKGYLRGSTLDTFDGRTWSRGSAGAVQSLYPDSNGMFKLAGSDPAHKRRSGLRQTITLIDTSGSTLFGSPYIGEVFAPLATLQYTADGSLHWTRGWRKPLRYDVVSFEQPVIPAPRPARAVAGTPNYLQLPSIPLLRVEILARQIGGRRSPLKQAQAIESYLRTHYPYSLDLGAKTSTNPIEDFLFVRQRGPCGHFASAMAVMLRLQGIPSRVVAGYYKGTWNERLGQYLIRERDAHAWVEAYDPQAGWVSFDPSPRTVAPMEASRWALRSQEYWQYVNYQWDRMVIEYDLYSQVKVVEDIQSNTNRVNSWIDRNLMGFRNPNTDRRPQERRRHFSGIFTLIAAFVLLIVGVKLIRILLRRPTTHVDPSIVFYHKLLRRMARQGFPKGLSETGWEYAQRLASHKDSAQVLDLTRRYYRTRFATTSSSR